jgi:hypothetical protein
MVSSDSAGPNQLCCEVSTSSYHCPFARLHSRLFTIHYLFTEPALQMFSMRVAPASYVVGDQTFLFGDEFQTTINQLSQSMAADLKDRTSVVPDLLASVLDPRLKRQ